ncbi:MAG TPA: hypothetical protein VHO50_10225 [Bacteroidales bacterium]|nr:hypothetical protein [Bacteroidales bacterium]
MKNCLENNKYLLFIGKLTVLMLILYLLDYSVGNTMRYFYFSQKSGKQYRTTYILEEVKTDILIMGSSRANHHYHPDTFENELGISFYNAGRDGNFIFYHYAILQSVLKRYTPKIVILDILRDEFSADQISYDRLSSLLPYYHDHPEIRPVVELRSPYERIKMFSSIYPYNSSIFTIIGGNLGIGSEIGRENKGYVSINRTMSGSDQENINEPAREIDPRKVAVFESFTEECIASGVRLFIICSPYYKSAANVETLEIAENIAKKHNIPFFDFSNEPAFKGRNDLFADYWHLNNDGAKVFSSIIAKEVGKDISKTFENQRFTRHETAVE